MREALFAIDRPPLKVEAVTMTGNGVHQVAISGAAVEECAGLVSTSLVDWEE